ncbi:MAG: agmatine deiminase family protein [Flavobacteriales bacterium]|jgi:agmatine deiminase|tara:strand:+ start:5500 stop:5955 length:456 start_codon:yes stop_codon:yes gene_type:complete
MENVTILVIPNDDFWVRDNGPVFVYDEDSILHITDWGFNSWGNDTPFELCDEVLNLIANQLDIPLLDLSAMILEGGAIEIDGEGSVMLTRSSITGDDRNPNLTEEEIENYMTTYLGLTNFIWLDGMFGGWEDITDQHIDGFAKFHGTKKLL